jgi:hypothetical protein
VIILSSSASSQSNRDAHSIYIFWIFACEAGRLSAEDVYRPGDHERDGRNRGPTAASSSSSPSGSAS